MIKYECPSCKTKFEKEYFNDLDVIMECPECKREASMWIFIPKHEEEKPSIEEVNKSSNYLNLPLEVLYKILITKTN
jgi:rubredoxin